MKSKKELDDALLKAHLVRASAAAERQGCYYLEHDADLWIRVLNWVLERETRGSDFGQDLDDHVKRETGLP